MVSQIVLEAGSIPKFTMPLTMLASDKSRITGWDIYVATMIVEIMTLSEVLMA